MVILLTITLSQAKFFLEGWENKEISCKKVKIIQRNSSTKGKKILEMKKILSLILLI